MSKDRPYGSSEGTQCLEQCVRSESLDRGDDPLTSPRHYRGKRINQKNDQGVIDDVHNDKFQPCVSKILLFMSVGGTFPRRVNSKASVSSCFQFLVMKRASAAEEEEESCSFLSVREVQRKHS